MLISDNTDLISGGLWDMDSGIDAIYQPPGIRPVFTIPLISSIAASKSAVVPTFNRDTTGTYIDPSTELIDYAAIDEARFEDAGILIEDDATNLVTYSNDLTYRAPSFVNHCVVTSEAIESPDGSSTCQFLYANSPTTYSTSSDTPRYYKSIPTSTIGTVYTYSVCLKHKNLQWVHLRSDGSGSFNGANFDILNGVVGDVSNGYTASIKPVGDTGFYRCSVTTTITSNSWYGSVQLISTNSNSGTVEADKGVYIFGEQFEASEYPTSYIPTEASAVTRIADELSYDIEDIITQGKGSIYWEFDFLGVNSGDTPRIIELHDGTESNRISLSINDSKILTCSVINSGSPVASISTASALTANTKHKVFLTYKDYDIKLYLNGELVGSEASGLVPDVTDLSVGCDYVLENQLGGHVKYVKYFKDIIPEAEAIRITT